MRLNLAVILLPLLVTVKAEGQISEGPINHLHVEQPIHRIPRPLPKPNLVRELIPTEEIIPAPSTESQPESTPLLPLPDKRPIQRPVLRPAPRPLPRPIPQPTQQPLPVQNRDPEPQDDPEIQTEPQPTQQPQPVVTQAPVRPIYRPATRPFYRPAVRPTPRPVQTPVPLPTQQPDPITPAPLLEPHTEPVADPEPTTENHILRPAPRPHLPRPTVPRPVLRPAPRPIQQTPEEKMPRPLVPRPVIRPTPYPRPQYTTPKPEPPQPDQKIVPAPTPEPTIPPSKGGYRPTAKPLNPVWTQKPIPVITTKKPKPYNPTKEVPIEFDDDLGTPIDFNCVQDGYYSVAGECDSYIKCSKRTAMIYLCPDGLYFNKNARRSEYPCAIPSEVQCEVGAMIHESQPTDQCPHQNGFFSMKDGDCSHYISCEYGLATIMQCPPGLAFNDELSACDWPENVPSCNPNAFQGFTCPAPSPDEDPDWIYKYKHGKSCKYYIACQRGHPRLLSCDPGLAFDEGAETCIDDQYVSNCSN